MIRIVFGVLFALVLLGTAAPAKAAFNVQVVSTFNNIPPNQTDLMSINCPAGTVVVSGGWNASPGQAPSLNVWVSRQIVNGWRIMTNNLSNAFQAIHGYAVCASGIAGLSSYSSSVPVNVPSFNTGVGTTFCPSGGIPTGGGFDSNFPNPAHLIPVANLPANQNQWTGWEYNSTSSAKAFTLFITCTKNLNGSVIFRAGNQVSFKNTYGEATVDCNAGDFAIGGGFVSTILTSSPEVTVQKVRTFRNMPSLTNRRRWVVGTHSSNQFDFAFVTPYAQCLHLN
jgi:hypothetical protein